MSPRNKPSSPSSEAAAESNPRPPSRELRHRRLGCALVRHRLQYNSREISQNNSLKAVLLSTGNNTIGKASTSDRIWGIGLHSGANAALTPCLWPGSNKLGKALMRARDSLRSSAPATRGRVRQGPPPSPPHEEDGGDQRNHPPDSGSAQSSLILRPLQTRATKPTPPRALAPPLAPRLRSIRAPLDRPARSFSSGEGVSRRSIRALSAVRPGASPRAQEPLAARPELVDVRLRLGRPRSRHPGPRRRPSLQSRRAPRPPAVRERGRIEARRRRRMNSPRPQLHPRRQLEARASASGGVRRRRARPVDNGTRHCRALGAPAAPRDRCFLDAGHRRRPGRRPRGLSIARKVKGPRVAARPSDAPL